MARPDRGPRGRFVSSEQTADKWAEALRLRARGLSYAEIARAIGYADHANARRAVEQALAATIREPAEEVRLIELQKLDTWERAALGVLERRHLTVSHGQVVRLGCGCPVQAAGKGLTCGHEQGEPLLDDAPVLTAIDRLLKIQERRAKLLGLDAPKRLEVITLDAVDAEIARLTAELGQRVAAELAAPDVATPTTSAGTAGTPS